MRYSTQMMIGSFLILVSLYGCSQVTPVTTSISTDESYPAPPKIVNSNPYPMETSDYSSFLQEETPDPTKGRVIGKIFLRGQPVVYSTLFLADVLVDEKTGIEISAALDRSIAPKTITDENGEFTFSNVRPGRYGLILIVGTEIYLLLYPDSELGVLLTVEFGEIDLGILDYSDLPLD